MFLVEKNTDNCYHWKLVDENNNIIARSLDDGYLTKEGVKSSMRKVRDAIIHGNVTIKDLTSEE